MFQSLSLHARKSRKKGKIQTRKSTFVSRCRPVRSALDYDIRNSGIKSHMEIMRWCEEVSHGISSLIVLCQAFEKSLRTFYFRCILVCILIYVSRLWSTGTLKWIFNLALMRAGRLLDVEVILNRPVDIHFLKLFTVFHRLNPDLD